jgi:polysaccharide deacetylase family protein (PEP-CTERM system associated)
MLAGRPNEPTFRSIGTASRNDKIPDCRSGAEMKNTITIDLEDYYQVSAFNNPDTLRQWDLFPSRIEHSTAKLLSILDELSVKATFFTLGWVAKRFPKLVREIAEGGHEIACHSHLHRSVVSMTPDEFREDTVEAKRVLEDLVGKRVYGYRAPSFSIKTNSLWAFEVLAELGFLYDSSVFPIRHANYGWPRAPRFPFRIATGCGAITEFPMPTLEWRGERAPIGGGAYLRLLPYWYTRWGIRYLNDFEGLSVCLYMHPWEMDCEQPKMKGSPSALIRHYLGLGGTESKFRRLLSDFISQPLVLLLQEFNTEADRGRQRLPEVPLARLGSYLGGKRTLPD